MARLNTPAARILLGLAVPVLILFWWQAQSAQGGARALAFVPLQDVGATLVSQLASGFLLNDALATLSRAVTGLLLGGLVGTALGVAMAMSRPLDRVVGPLYHAVRQVPLLGWLPLIGLWVGNGDEAKLLIVSLAAFYPTVLNSYEGVRTVERRYVEVAELFGFSAAQRFVHLLLPAALPLILTGVAQALAFAWIATIGTEILFGADAGLGATMGVAQAQQRMDIILVAILAAASLGFTLHYSITTLRRHLLRWQPAIN